MISLSKQLHSLHIAEHLIPHTSPHNEPLYSAFGYSFYIFVLFCVSYNDLMYNFNTKLIAKPSLSFRYSKIYQKKKGIICSDNLLSFSLYLILGNSFDKRQLLLKYLKVEKAVNYKTFNAIQQQLVCPVIEEYWKERQEAVLQEFHGKDVILCGTYFLYC